VSGRRPKVTIATPHGEASVAVEVVATLEAIRRGLMFRDYLAPHDGMLFFMGADFPWRFHMQNTYVPLDIIFITRDFIVAGVIADAQPHSSALGIATPSRYVLEVNAGWAAAHGVVAGCSVRFE
jgi:uncharacterized membrane protein (UPF0127 family)